MTPLTKTPAQQLKKWLADFQKDIQAIQKTFTSTLDESIIKHDEAELIGRIAFNQLVAIAQYLTIPTQISLDVVTLQKHTENIYLNLTECCSESLRLIDCDLVPILQFHLDKLDYLTARPGYEQVLQLSPDQIRINEYETIMEKIHRQLANSDLQKTIQSPARNGLHLFAKTSLLTVDSHFISPKNNNDQEKDVCCRCM